MTELLARIAAHLRRFQAQQVLREQATTDELTGLLNRRGVFDALARELARSRRANTVTSLLLADVDHFKDVNDSHGHATGDEVLRAVSHSLSTSVRTCDRVARLGGDEFVVVLPDTDWPAAYSLEQRLGALRPTAPLPRNTGVIQVAVSLGAATSRPNDSADTLLERADIRMYDAKRRCHPTLHRTHAQ